MTLAGSDCLGVEIFWFHSVLAGKIFEGLALGFRNKKSGEDTTEHEECVDLHNVVEPWACGGLVWAGSDSTTGTEWCNGCLGDDGADLAGSGGETVRGRTVTGRETFTWDDEGRCIGSC